MKKVLIIPSWYPSAETPTAGIFVYEHAQALKKTGHDVAVLYIQQGPKSLEPSCCFEDGIVVVRSCVGFGHKRKTFLGRKMAGIRYRLAWCGAFQSYGIMAFLVLRESGFTPDIIHVHALWPAGLVARAIKKLFDIPFVVTEHSEEYLVGTDRKLIRIPGMLQLILRPLARQSSAYIAVSEWFARRLEHLGLFAHVDVVGNVVPARESVLPFDVAMSAANGIKRIVHVSLLGSAKNLSMLLQAIAQLAVTRKDFVLYIIGDGPSRVALEFETMKLGLLDTNVRFMGQYSSDQINDMLDQSAFSVLSSIYETFSVFAVESLMAGRPVLSTRCGGPEEFISESVGRLVENNNVDAMVQGLSWMLDNYVQFKPDALNDYAIRRFSPEAICAQLDSIYERVLDCEATINA